ncbi:DUF805 domain-containing protein [Mesorhizobium sp. CAU 1741]|uniref:DUF805 domain-containing protein n=1 Tax=Mesorhizobium sp. CAU 1741 TaxID=3140366 RepID=UPI00325A7459
MPANQMIWLFFGFSGRLSRAAYFLAGLLMMIAVVFITYRMIMAQESGQSGAVWETLLSVVLLASLWAQAALGAKRLHDFARPGIFAALLFVPFFNFITFVALCFIPGTPGPNQYGTTTNAPAAIGKT